MQCSGCQGNGDTEQQSHLKFLPNCLGATHAPTVPVPLVCLISHKSTGLSPIAVVQENDKATKFYPGLESWKLFEHILNFLVKSCPSLAIPSANMLLSECLLLVLMHLRLSLQVQDLSCHFGLTVPRVSDVFQKWINSMFTCLKFLIIWIPQEVVYAKMPQIFKDLYPYTKCIIDCSEIFIECPYSYRARARMYSIYKKHNTVKFHIGITTKGVISFLSKYWGEEPQTNI